MKEVFWQWLFWLGMIISATCHLDGQEVTSFQHLSKRDGLSQVSVFAIAQDSAGFMWFGTRNGLNKFDGYQFKVYKKDTSSPSLVADDVRYLYSDPVTHDLWIGTISGLGRYQMGMDKFSNYLNAVTDSTSLSNNVIRQVFRDSRGRLWVGTSIGLNLYQKEQDNFIRYYLKDSRNLDIVSKDIKVIFEDSENQIWVGTNDGLYRLLEEDTLRFEQIENISLSDTHIKSIVENPDHNLWIGTDRGGLNYWNRSQNKMTIYKSDKNAQHKISHNTIRSMVMDHNENLWVGTFDGLNLLEKGQTEFKILKKEVFSNTGISDQSIHSLYVDRSGSLWIGTYYGGVNHWVDKYNQFKNFKYIPNQNSLSGNVVSSFAEDEKNNLWIGTEGGGLNYFDKEKNQFQHYQFQSGVKNSLSGNNIKTMLLDKDQLWIGTFKRGLNRLDIPSGKFTHFKANAFDKNILAAGGTSLSNNSVYGLHKEGDLLWVLTYGSGLDILEVTTNKFHNFSENAKDTNSISSDLVRVVLKTATENFWIGTEKGLNKVFLDENGLPNKFKTYFPNETIYSLQESSNQKIWMGTYTNGLYLFDPENGKSTHFTTADGLAGNTIFGILEFNEEEVWLSTNNGITRFNLKEKSFTNYDYSNGLANLEHNFNAYYKTRSNNFLFGGINGFTEFNPQHIQPNKFIPPIVFTELRQNNNIVTVREKNTLLQKGINYTESLKFNYNEANFTISFAALDYFSPENNRYAYMLEGLDKEWNFSVGKTAASYAIQKEGSYTFRLKGANSDGLWNEQERTIEIIVQPPAYRTWWASLIYLFILGMAIYALIRYIRLGHTLQLQQVSKEKQDEIHEMKLRFYTNITHEFRTPLTLILGPLKQLLSRNNQPESVTTQLVLVEKNARRLLNLVNQLMTFRKLATDHEPMKIVEHDIINFLKEIYLLFQEHANSKNIDYQFFTNEITLIVGFDQDKLEKVFFNLLSNAFKFTPKGGKISLHVKQVNHSVEVQVQDSGPGITPELHDQIFKRFYEKEVSQPSAIKGSGVGLAISRQMVALHGGKIYVQPQLNEKKQGATFVVEIPIDKAKIKQEINWEENYKNQQIQPYILSEIVNEPVVAQPTETEKISGTKEQPLLLIVEDNADIRAYIHATLNDNYQIITAENGVEGLQKAKEQPPELIISDVMMPQMDGITFCRKVKTDIEISHIPIILLTARTAGLFKIEGLKTGADDYITKPFDPEELRLRVRNTIQARQEIKNKFARVLTFDPKEILITSADEVFLENAMTIVENNIDNYLFNVQQFATDLTVSRALLFTKLKALTGQTPNNFIKTIRLKRAAQLLKTQKLNVSEIAYKVGFKDPKYFRKCFKEQFNILPSVYGKQLKT